MALDKEYSIAVSRAEALVANSEVSRFSLVAAGTHRSLPIRLLEMRWRSYVHTSQQAGTGKN